MNPAELLFASPMGDDEDGSRLTLSSPLGGAAQSSLRSCLNFDLIKGIDDDPLDLTVSPAISLEAHGGRTEEETTAGATKHGGFTLDDVGRRVTIDSKKRQVFIDGVERRMRWFRQVPKAIAMVEGNEWRRKMGFNTEWREWKPGDWRDAEIVRVEPEAGGIVRLMKAGKANAKQLAAHSIDNPEPAGARLNILDIGAGTFEGKGKARSAPKTKDRIGGELSSAGVNTHPTPKQNGTRSDFNRRDMVRMPGEIAPNNIQVIRASRHLWRAKASALLDNPGTIKEKGSQPVERKEAVLDFSIIEKSKADLIKGMVGKLRMNVGAATDAPAKSPVCFTSRDRIAASASPLDGTMPSDSAVKHPAPPQRAMTRKAMLQVRNLKMLTTAVATADEDRDFGAGPTERPATEKTTHRLLKRPSLSELPRRASCVGDLPMFGQKSSSSTLGEQSTRADRLQGLRARVASRKESCAPGLISKTPSLRGDDLSERSRRSHRDLLGVDAANTSNSSLLGRSSSRMDAQIAGEVKDRPGRAVTRGKDSAKAELGQMLTMRKRNSSGRMSQMLTKPAALSRKSSSKGSLSGATKKRNSLASMLMGTGRKLQDDAQNIEDTLGGVHHQTTQQVV